MKTFFVIFLLLQSLILSNAQEKERPSSSSSSQPLSKGPWTREEDVILIAYVNRHGTGNWNDVQRHTSLARSGKSCRLRWLNHLCQNLKKSRFSRAEELRICRLHHHHGNKWSLIARQLPGRTDNAIKNFWHTRVKRLQKDELPIYPKSVIEEAMPVNQQQGISPTPTSSSSSSPSLTVLNPQLSVPNQFWPRPVPFNRTNCKPYYQGMMNVPFDQANAGNLHYFVPASNTAAAIDMASLCNSQHSAPGSTLLGDTRGIECGEGSVNDASLADDIDLDLILGGDWTRHCTEDVPETERSVINEDIAAIFDCFGDNSTGAEERSDDQTQSSKSKSEEESDQNRSSDETDEPSG